MTPNRQTENLRHRVSETPVQCHRVSTRHQWGLSLDTLTQKSHLSGHQTTQPPKRQMEDAQCALAIQALNHVPWQHS